jgi:hypothetical protein
MTRIYTAVLLVLAILAATLILITPSSTTYQQPEATPPDDDGPIPMAPFEPMILATSTIEIEEPLPLPKKLPPGVNCLEDCPLIVPDVEAVVRDHFRDNPIMVEIARCESTFKHWDTDGSVLMNRQGSSATGVMQLMASYHARPAEKMGLDITDLEGNLAYAEYLYDRQGTTPWNASRNCWGSALALI